jgi:hypothetical protein
MHMHRITHRVNELRRGPAIRLIAIIAMAGLAGCGAGSGGVPPASPVASDPRIRCQETVSLGTLDHGMSGEAQLRLENPHDREFEVSRVEVSCPCLKVSPETFRLEPGSSKTLVLRFDPKEEPDFSGGLAIKVAGQTAEGQEVFGTTVRVTVNPPKTDAAH